MHFQRNALAQAGKSGRRVVSAFIATAFPQPDHAAASAQWRAVADQMRRKLLKLAALMDGAQEDVLPYMTFPVQHCAKLRSTNPIERLNGKIKRRTDVVGVFPNEAAIRRLVGAILMEQTEEWAVQRSRDTTLEPSRPSAMIPSSASRPRRATDQFGAAEIVRPEVSYTTTRDRIQRKARLCPQPYLDRDKGTLGHRSI